MKFHPKGFGGDRTPPEKIKQDGWQSQGVLVVGIDEPRLTWPERELVCQIGEKLYGARRETPNG